jgi:tetratricopeptide (TPR) repeat protein
MRFNPMLAAGILAGALILPGAAGASPITSPAASISTDESDSLYVKAGDLYAAHNYREAIPLFEKVVELDPRNANAFALLGGSYFQLGDYPRAITAFEQALRLDEGIKLAYLGLVAANYLSERVGQAQEWVQRLVPILTGEERERYLAMISAQFPGLGPAGMLAR